ncbi:Rieske (2Fe-2S) protein [Planosporangium mesophilum]|uniref:Cytochrome bc1 complex Rieske iron-sulfur subunit n=1 Tax=Planosporangium mesophilum TaxID=689768 RepID=A0A8J3THR2_9ACTN|nr:Rieske (2Fe-2S) protein [Planosporangium mesophilum]NJC83313.1 Rieske (2Fe-2S) protein [Planosporangium mesophilum]GII21690.1 iron-sulfur protein [Planosporangium mesophilum]
MSETTRRGVIAGAAGVGAAAVLAACGSDTSSPAPNTGTDSSGGAPSAPAASGQQQGGQQAGAALAKTNEIPVGGGKVIESQKLVVTQPVAGEYKAFTAVCTHSGCLVTTVANGTINCPCHGSKFSAADGSVKGGPAKAPLAAKPVNVQGDSIVLA